MKKNKIDTFCFFTMIFLFTILLPSQAHAAKIAIMEIDVYGYEMYQKMKKLNLPDTIETRMFTVQDLEKNDPANKEYLSDCTVIFVDVMIEELAEYLIENHLTKDKYVYALSMGGDPKKLMENNFLFDREISRYGMEDVVNMVRLAVNRHIDNTVTYEPPKQPEPWNRQTGLIYHPDAKTRFDTAKDYKKWNSSRKNYRAENPWIGVMFGSDALKPGLVEAADKLIRKLETEGFNVLPSVGMDQIALNGVFKGSNGKAPVKLIITFGMLFASSITDEVRQVLSDINVPVINVKQIYMDTLDQWRKSAVGYGPFEVVWAVATPEFSGAIEPTPLIGKIEISDPDTGRKLMIHDTIEETVDHLIPRLKKWIVLQNKPNSEKKVAIIYYNHGGGKQDIGAGYLNVFRSLEVILHRMKQEGYDVQNADKLTEEGLKEMVLKSGRNIGTWAPGELETMLKSADVDHVSLEEYKTWFDKLPDDFKTKVIADSGTPEDYKVMAKDGRLHFPMVKLGNIVLMPEPSRGGGNEKERIKLYHDPDHYPSHQYIAGYLWIGEKFKADAMVHLGAHATYEWLPGKQAGLSPSDPPEIMTGDIPNLYPYLVDNVGEGIQAKRRGRGVIIDHLTPPVKEADLYNEYANLHDLFHKYELAKSMGSETVPEYMKMIQDEIHQTGIDKDLRITQLNDDAMEEVHLYLHEIDDNILPYGLHTYGKPYTPESAEETVNLIMKQNPDADATRVRKDLDLSPVQEMDNFIRGLKGEYIAPGEGNDPLRNLPSIPTGRNFYGFSPNKIPSKAAWEVGKKAALQIMENQLKKDGHYPEKVGVVLWAVETTRNEGVNESTILYLMGMEPVWDATGRVTGSRVIPGPQLGRPRIDVLINPSGLYRDAFPSRLIFLDEAVQKALVQTDIENLLAKNSARIQQVLMEKGLTKEEAEMQSRFRIFTQKTGSYGNGVSGRVKASPMWESDEAVSKAFLNRDSFAVGQGRWSVPVKDAFTENLRDVDVTVHSRSSNVIGIIDNDDFFSDLGGFTLAVKHVSGKTPDTMMTMHRRKDEAMVEDVAKTIGRELRTRYFNPQWITGMKQDNYAGAREMAEFVENLWGWQVTVADAVDKTKWEQVFEVYVEDKYGQEIKAFFNQHNPWAYQSITARMLETVRKDYWQPDEKIVQKLAVEYAVNVVEKGVACCHHTCNNPMLNQMVYTIISMPGVLSPEMAEKFKLAIEKMAEKELAEQVKDQEELLKDLNNSPDTAWSEAIPDAASENKSDSEETLPDAMSKKADESVEGYKMEDVSTQDESTALTSSGVQWAATLFVLLVLGLFVWGIVRRRPLKRMP